MKRYVPILIVVVVIVAVIGVRQLGMRQAVTPGGLGDEPSVSAMPETGETSEYTTPVPTTAGSSVVQASGITLTVTSPSNNATVTSASLTVRGKTVSNAEVFVNDEETRADSSGNFSVTLTLDEGENFILVAANDSLGNFAERELTVTYSP